MTTSERWQRIEQLYHAALERGVSERDPFLADACGDDDPLRHDVESLLAADAQAQAFLAESAMHVAARECSESAVSLVGRQLGSYQLQALLGAGGMGEVYRARDVTLGRDVAVKVLPASVVHEADRVARFRREAQMLASLNHPHIAHIHGLEEADGAQFLILELVEGQTLAERLHAGRLPIDEALAVARQIAEGLEAAHEKGIIHRDLKPANIAFTADGQVKLLDFGLAKALDTSHGATANATHSPTLTTPGALTDVGVILGTVAYMSPEQATGRPADRRSDIWAFGCVLYEMLTGRVAFEGDSVSDMIATILTRELDWSALPTATPAHVRRLLQRCLRKDPKQRLHDIADARIELEEGSSESSDAQSTTGTGKPTASKTALVVAVGLALVVFGALITWRVSGFKSELSAPATRIALSVSADNSLTLDGDVAISPDGQTLAFVARSADGTRLYIRRFDEWEAHGIPGTESAASPFFSPDGDWVAFTRGPGPGMVAEGRLEKVPTRGGPRQLLCDCQAASMGGAWGQDGTIMFPRMYADAGLWRISADGGAPESVIRPTHPGEAATGDSNYAWPQRLPSNRGLLFTIRRRGKSSVAVLARGDTEPRTVIASGYAGKYLSDGHVAYVSGGRLRIVPFDLQKLAAGAGDTVIVDDVAEGFNQSGYDVSANGTLVYVPSRFSLNTLVWKDRQGRTTPLGLNERRYSGAPRLSPDGQRLVVTVVEDGSTNVWIGRVDREPLTRLTFGNADNTGPWMPDGQRVIYGSGEHGAFNLFLAPADGSGQPQRITNSPNPQLPTSVSPDGDVVLFNEIDRPTGIIHIGQASIGGHDLRPFAGGRFNEQVGKLSRDGRWVAYESNESGKYEVYVRPYPGPGSKTQVSVGGGETPRWRADGRELFYRTANSIVAVQILDTQDFRAGTPVRLFTYTGPFDVSPDGQRFLAYEKAEAGRVPSQLNLIQNWFAELKQRVPTNKP